MPIAIPDCGIEFFCDGETHSFEFATVIVFGFPCNCYKGALEDCPRCLGSGVVLVNDGGGHMDEVDCPNNHQEKKG